jgi:CheY-like chemotaxis protein
MSDKEELSNISNKGVEVTTKTILIVEDDDSIGTFLIDVILQETPYKAMRVRDGFQALTAAHNLKPALFITDYRLPSMDGIELYDQLHLTQDLANTPVIIMSAYLPEQEIKERHMVCLSKPFELDDLLNTVERLLA